MTHHAPERSRMQAGEASRVSCKSCLSRFGSSSKKRRYHRAGVGAEVREDEQTAFGITGQQPRRVSFSLFQFADQLPCDPLFDQAGFSEGIRRGSIVVERAIGLDYYGVGFTVNRGDCAKNQIPPLLLADTLNRGNSCLLREFSVQRRFSDRGNLRIR